MNKHLLSFFVVAILYHTNLYAQVNILWQQRFSQSGNSSERAVDIFVDASKNVYITGSGKGTSGTLDIITIKYDPTGAELWRKEYNNTTTNSYDEAVALAVDASGNVYVVGSSDGGVSTTGYDFVTIKYNAAGVQQWVKRYSTGVTGGYDNPKDIGVDNGGNVYVCGSIDTTSNVRGIVLKLTSSGNIDKKFVAASGGMTEISALIVNPVLSEVYFSGFTYKNTAEGYNFVVGRFDSNLASIWTSQYNSTYSQDDYSNAIALDAAGNVYVTGEVQETNMLKKNFATVKFDAAAGTKIWDKLYNGTGNDIDVANAIAVDPVGNRVYVTGKSNGIGVAGSDIVTISYNTSNGNSNWENRYNSSDNGYDEGKAITVDASGNVYVTGGSFTAGKNNDYVTIKYDVLGNQQWLTKYNGTGNNVDLARGIAVDALNNVYITGYSVGSGSNDDFETIKYCQLTATAGADTTICKGNSAQLHASAPGAVSYSWTPTNGSLSATNIANPVATPTDTTMYVVAITNTNGCTDYDTVRVNVLPAPAAVITTNRSPNLCPGDSVTLTAGNSLYYQWSSSANDTVQSITVKTAATYSVTVKNGVGCVSASTSKTVTILPLPSIDAGPNDTTCLSTNFQLQASGGVSYVWSPASSLSDPLIFNPMAGPVVPTIYKVIGTGANGCKNTDSVRIEVLLNPGVPTITIASGILNCSPAYSGYLWYFNGSPLPSWGQTYVPTNNGTYYVEAFNAFGCSSVSTSITITQVGIAENEQNSFFSVYPNPASENISLDITLKDQTILKVKIMNVNGQLVYSEDSHVPSGSYKKTISLNDYPSGIYFIQAITNDGVGTVRMIKE